MLDSCSEARVARSDRTLQAELARQMHMDAGGMTRLPVAGPMMPRSQTLLLSSYPRATRAADDLFLGSALLFLALVALAWFTRRPQPAGGGAGAAADAGGAH